ncbi:MAG: dTDP-glucose 4,6-dehydratase [Fimbriimonadaceae bacterium]|jgi:dTDP-glucose 4,6-dehydratase|nr:dTDP-glucose 4,6-dehydratase [Fimbriimonadaceae bacterium]
MILVTGGCGFIGANFLNWATREFPHEKFVNLDVLTYAANRMSVREAEERGNCDFRQIDLANEEQVRETIRELKPQKVFHFAAETHVDRSIRDPRIFVHSNILGTFHLLEACREVWGNHWEGKVFHHVSTDEVYGSLGDTGAFVETTAYDPSSPYSATKAASDHLVNAYCHTYGFPAKITNCSNNYGPYQFPEKLIPLMILNCLAGKSLPVYGEGTNVRDWLFVWDHCDAIWKVAHHGKNGETYNIGGASEKRNIDIVKGICTVVEELTGRKNLQDLITFVPDRPGHDWRYAIDFSKVEREIGWLPSTTFEQGLRKTVTWYLENSKWVESVQTGEYRNWIATHYQGEIKP